MNAGVDVSRADDHLDRLVAQATCQVFLPGNQPMAAGTAWLFSKRGYMLTAAHVISGYLDKEVKVRFDSGDTQLLDVSVVLYNYDDALSLDVAILRLKRDFNRHPLPLCFTERAADIHQVYSRGYPASANGRQMPANSNVVGPVDDDDLCSLLKLDSLSFGEKGFSGAAVVALTLQSVIGIATDARTAGRRVLGTDVLVCPLARISSFVEPYLDNVDDLKKPPELTQERFVVEKNRIRRRTSKLSSIQSLKDKLCDWMVQHFKELVFFVCPLIVLLCLSGWLTYIFLPNVVATEIDKVIDKFLMTGDILNCIARFPGKVKADHKPQQEGWLLPLVDSFEQKPGEGKIVVFESRPFRAPKDRLSIRCFINEEMRIDANDCRCQVFRQTPDGGQSNSYPAGTAKFETSPTMPSVIKVNLKDSIPINDSLVIVVYLKGSFHGSLDALSDPNLLKWEVE